MKKVLVWFLCIIICVSVVPTQALGLTTVEDNSFGETLASDLKDLGLFKGVSDTNFDLAREPSRIEALVMLIRVLGKENEALNGNWKHSFTDIPSWADKYVGYAYENGLTNGISSTLYGTGNASAKMYLTFMLRALGYSDTNGIDFSWDNPFGLAKSAHILPNSVNTVLFYRSDVVLVSYAALTATLKGSTQTLAQTLITAGVFTQVQYETYYDTSAISNYEKTSNTELTAEEIYAQCSPAVFYIEVYNSKGTAVGFGSGFFIDSDGTAITNYHVIDGIYSAKITVSDSEKTYDVLGVYDYNQDEDWAVLKINGSGFSYLDIGDSSTVIGGASVYAIGSPRGLQNTISQGLISNTNRTEGGVSYIQTSAAISPGSSGGALINKYGQVIGITSASYVNGQNLNLALPIRYISNFSKENCSTLLEIVENPRSKLISYANYPDIPDCGAYYGVNLYNSTSDSASSTYYYTIKSLIDVGAWASGMGAEKYQNVLQDWGAVYVSEVLAGSAYYWAYSLETTQKSYDIHLGYTTIDNIQFLYVKIASNTKALATGYSECTAVPDFGAFFGVKSLYADDVIIGTVKLATNYGYSVEALDKKGVGSTYFNTYWKLLNEWGFQYMKTETTSLGNKKYIFQNSKMGYEIAYSVSDGTVMVNIFYSLIS